jgi:hypothetical protein
MEPEEIEIVKEDTEPKREKKAKGRRDLNDDETITKMMKRAREQLSSNNTNYPIKHTDMKYLDDLDLSDISGLFLLTLLSFLHVLIFRMSLILLFLPYLFFSFLFFCLYFVFLDFSLLTR